MKTRSQIGFTLLELLIAMVIFSFMSIMAYGALGNIFKSNEGITAQAKKLKDLKRTMMFVERDIRQIVLRPRREGFGSDEQVSALISGFDNEGIVEFTRSGNSNPSGIARSSLQRVRYKLEESTIKRLSWNLVDHIGAEPVVMPLLKDVEGFSWRFLNDKGVFLENWSSNKELPRAIELVLEHKAWGKIVRLISVK